MVDVTPGAVDAIPPAEVADVELYHPHSWWTKYVFSPGCQGHRHPVFAAPRIAIGLVALVLSWLMRLQLGFPGTFAFIDARCLLPVHHHARHDHGDLSAHRAVPRRLRQLPDPADGRRARHGVSLCQHAELLDLSARRAGAGRELLRAGRTDRRRLDALSAAGHHVRHARRPGLGHHPDARLADHLHHRLHHGRPELRRDGAAGRARAA